MLICPNHSVTDTVVQINIKNYTMSQINDFQFIHVLLGNQHVIKNYKTNADSLLLVDPFEFCVTKYAIGANILEAIKNAVLYDSYVEISLEEYMKYHEYQCGALDLIFSGRLLDASRYKIDTDKSR